jgi:hypothetical protein
MFDMKLRRDVCGVNTGCWKKPLTMHAKGFHKRTIIELSYDVNLNPLLAQPIIDFDWCSSEGYY